MKKIMYYVLVASSVFLYSMSTTGCSSDDDITKEIDNNKDKTIVEGPSSDDVLTVPTDVSYLGDSIRTMRSFSLVEHEVKKVVVSTTQNGHISVLGGYKDKAVVYVYAKVDDDDKKGDLNDEQIKNILEKYYTIESYVNDTEIVAKVNEKSGVSHGTDFRNLRISVKVFTPQNVSTQLNIGRGSIIANNVRGNQHSATSTSGAIKYINSYGGNFTVNSEAGYIGLINTSASQTIDAKLVKGNIMIALAKDTKVQLNLNSSTKVNAFILNNSNFSGTNTRTKVEGKLNGGGYAINANSGLGVINLKWYEGNDDEY